MCSSDLDLGNTVLVVEHDEDTMRAADHIVDFGPGPGVRGGEVVAMGRPEEVAAIEQSHTGRWLRTVLPELASRDSKGGSSARKASDRMASNGSRKARAAEPHPRAS